MDELRLIRERLRAMDDPLRLLELLFAHAPIGLQIYDASGKSLLVNRAFRDMFGAEPPPDYNVFRDENLERRGGMLAVRQAFAGHTGRFGPFWYDARQLEHVRVTYARRVAIDVVTLPLPDSHGNIPHIALLFTDVTAAITATDSVQRSERRFRALIEHATEGTALVGANGMLLYRSPAVARILGHDPESGIGEPAYGNVCREDLPALMQALGEVIGKHGATARARYRLRHADGSWRWVDSAITNLVDDEAVGALVFNYRDITEHKLAEEENRRLAVDLERRVAERTFELAAIARDLESFTYSVSHDLRAPLRSISGFTRLLLDEHAAALDDEGRQYLQAVNDRAVTMDRLIDDLLAFARLGRQSLNKQPVETLALAREALKIACAGLPESEVVITLGDLPPCTADPALLRQVFVNLLSNAVKYSRARRPAAIEVGAAARDGAVVYFIRDNGIGFEMEYAQKIFGVFQRLHGASEYEGTGVGLAIVRRIIERHGGKIWAESEPGAGATFYWKLPPE
ncbi:MAG TPA: ATP-binding protein [Candidatus Limnocylindrales bacterium]|nr:ATP-binding protein [Candidatus Limnocylindrales bacterium]